MPDNEFNKTIIEKLVRTKIDFTYIERDTRLARDMVAFGFSDLYHQIKSVILNEEQNGRIIDEFLKEVDRQKNRDFDLLDDIKEEINNNFTNLEEQVEQVRKQALTFYYEKKWG